mmetsp:Transcript_104344/g.223091  ORF Transcript_104344/g.223091 Transcript_104344/m.223091 type:complete len:206 (-) Transcript_104344:16-633(-)
MLESLLELVVVVGHEVEGLVFDPSCVHAVLAIDELDDVVRSIPRCAIVCHLQCLHRLHQASLDVARLRSLARCVNDTLAATHGVHPDLLRCEACQVRVLHKPPGLGTIVVFRKVRQGAVAEPILDSCTLHVLLPDTSNNLGDVDWGALAPRIHHRDDIVPLVEGARADVTSILACCVQPLVDLRLEGLVHRFPGLRLELPTLGIS